MCVRLGLGTHLPIRRAETNFEDKTRYIFEWKKKSNLAAAAASDADAAAAADAVVSGSVGRYKWVCH